MTSQFFQPVREQELQFARVCKRLNMMLNVDKETNFEHLLDAYIEYAHKLPAQNYGVYETEVNDNGYKQALTNGLICALADQVIHGRNEEKLCDVLIGREPAQQKPTVGI